MSARDPMDRFGCTDGPSWPPSPSPRIPRAHPIIGAAVRARRAEAADDSGWPTTQQYPRESSNDAPFADEGPSPRTDWPELLMRAGIVAVFAAIVVWHAVARHGAPQ